MDRRLVIALVRGASAVLVLVAIAVQALTTAAQGTFNPTQFFAFFTIQSNLFGAALFLMLALRWRAPRSDSPDFLRGASVVYLTITFIVVILLLSGAELQVALPWVDFVLHKLFPIVVVVDWLADPPAQRISLRRSLLWLVYPSIWVGFTLVRGAIDGWYPYPFLNPANGGYGSVAFYFVAILIGFVVVGELTVVVGNALRDRSQVPAQPLASS